MALKKKKRVPGDLPKSASEKQLLNHQKKVAGIVAFNAAIDAEEQKLDKIRKDTQLIREGKKKKGTAKKR